MQVLRMDDPRDLLTKARQTQIARFASEKGLTEIAPDMPAMLMRKRIREKGLTGQFIAWARSNITPQVLGSPTARPVTSDDANAVDSDADLDAQWAQQQTQTEQEIRRYADMQDPPTAAPALATMGINELRAEGKRLGLTFARTDNKPSMRQKIEAALNGQNAA